MILPLLRVNRRELFQSAFPYLFFQERFCIKPEQAAVEHVVGDEQDCKQIHTPPNLIRCYRFWRKGHE